jgi:hypothetical protein
VKVTARAGVATRRSAAARMLRITECPCLLDTLSCDTQLAQGADSRRTSNLRDARTCRNEMAAHLRSSGMQRALK